MQDSPRVAHPHLRGVQASSHGSDAAGRLLAAGVRDSRQGGASTWDGSTLGGSALGGSTWGGHARGGTTGSPGRDTRCQLFSSQTALRIPPLTIATEAGSSHGPAPCLPPLHYSTPLLPLFSTTCALRIPPLTIVTEAAAMDEREVAALLAASGQNGQLFPALLPPESPPDGRPVPRNVNVARVPVDQRRVRRADAAKMRRALDKRREMGGVRREMGGVRREMGGVRREMGGVRMALEWRVSVDGVTVGKDDGCLWVEMMGACGTVTVGLYVKKEDLSEDYYTEEGEEVGEEEGEEVGKAEEGVRKERKGSAEDGSGSDGGSDSESSTTTTTSDWDTPSKGGSNGARGGKRRGMSKWARRRRAKAVEEARRSVEGKRLVAFGRAYSDGTLTAAVHDIAVAPIYRGRGLGTRVLQRILRELLSRGIGDISAVVWPNQRELLSRGIGDISAVVWPNQRAPPPILPFTPIFYLPHPHLGPPPPHVPYPLKAPLPALVSRHVTAAGGAAAARPVAGQQAAGEAEGQRGGGVKFPWGR
ncbi:unnamed protein product [Closterium sp. NIES-64]|nr:unnamed protein product [Closterium sp. NIES-64]